MNSERLDLIICKCCKTPAPNRRMIIIMHRRLFLAIYFYCRNKTGDLQVVLMHNCTLHPPVIVKVHAKELIVDINILFTLPEQNGCNDCFVRDCDERLATCVTLCIGYEVEY